MLRFPIPLVALCALPLIALSCASDTGGAGEPPREPTEGEVMPLFIQGSWRVDSIAGALEVVEPPATAKPPVIEFGPVRADGGASISGTAGLNRFFGDYAFSPGEGNIGGVTIGQLGSTRMAGPSDVMEFEVFFLETLRSARTIRGEEGGLVIDCTDAEIRLSPASPRSR